MQRYFAKDKKEQQFILGEDDIYHIKTVMRMKDGDTIYVVYDEETYICCLENVKKNIQIKVLEKLKTDEICNPKVTLYVPILKEQKMDYILQKATELGVYKIVPIETNRSIIRLNGKENKKLERWRRICKEASEQSHRTTIPIIEDIMELQKMKLDDGLKLLCSTVEKEKNIKYVLQKHKDCGKISVVMGPEGGLSETEEQYLKKIGYIPVTLGSNILRVETVPMFILSIVAYEYME